MKKFILTLVGLLFAVNLAFADCNATPEQALPAQQVKKEAVALRDANSYAQAAAKFEQAAAMHPMEAYQAVYLMNAIGCLLGKFDAVRGYRWVEDRGQKNAQKAYVLLDRVDALLKTADSCDYDNTVVADTHAWHDKQLKFLSLRATRDVK